MGYHDWKFHCAVLGVPEHSSPEEIKDAFRQLALRFHPDRNGGTSQAKEKFQRINTSYRYLMKNLASRPPLTTPDSPPSSPPLSSPPPPIPPQYRRQVLRSSGDSTKKIYQSFLQQQKNRFRSILPNFRSKPTRRTLVAAVCMIVAFVSTRYILRSTAEWQVIEPPPPVARLGVKRDAEGRMLARCDHLSFEKGSLVKKWSGDLSENECGHNCRAWFDAYEAYDGSCLWNGKEFQQHAAVDGNRNVASPVGGGGAWQVVNRPQARLRATIVADAEPEFEGKIRTIRKDVRLGEEDVLELDYVPSVWIGDKRLLLGREGASPQRILITPIRKGVTGVVLLDEDNQPRLKIIYDIQ